jgi:5-methylcytosine-specific restriction endonuclease McrA
MVPPRATPNESEARRESWLSNAAATFVSTSPANKLYYSVILEALWPVGHGVPGPVLTENQVRAAIDRFRTEHGKPPYKDVFRRMRELQGEEGFTGIRKEGNRYQLQSLEMSQKREPREKLSKADWMRLKQQYGFQCASCGRQEPDVRLSPDHKIPRIRQGSNEFGNLQPLCEQCNNIKSNSCQGCELNCNVCAWAFPAEYKQLIVADDNKALIRRAADRLGHPQSDLMNKILRDYFNTS